MISEETVSVNRSPDKDNKIPKQKTTGLSEKSRSYMALSASNDSDNKLVKNIMQNQLFSRGETGNGLGMYYLDKIWVQVARIWGPVNYQTYVEDEVPLALDWLPYSPDLNPIES